MDHRLPLLSPYMTPVPLRFNETGSQSEGLHLLGLGAHRTGEIMYFNESAAGRVTAFTHLGSEAEI